MAKAKKAEVTVSISDFLKENNTGSESKSKVPTVTNRGKEADSIRAALQELDDLTAMVEAKKVEFRAMLVEEYAARAQSGDFVKSLNVEGAKTPGVQITWKDQFSQIPVEQEASLRAAVGADYEKLFEQNRSISLQQTDDEAIKVLIEKCGPELFKKLFKIKVSIVPKSGMDQKQFGLTEQARSLVKQYEPSIKIIKD